MAQHKIDLQTQIGINPSGNPVGATRYRWRCSCGVTAMRWWASEVSGRGAFDAAEAARRAGRKHVRASKGSP